MRHNMFGEVYCQNADEIDEVMAEKDIYAGDVNAEIQYNEDTGCWDAEIRDNEDGETVFWVEGFEGKQPLTEALLGVGFARRDITTL